MACNARSFVPNLQSTLKNKYVLALAVKSFFDEVGLRGEQIPRFSRFPLENRPFLIHCGRGLRERAGLLGLLFPREDIQEKKTLASPQAPPTASNSSARALSATGSAPASAEG